MLIEVREENQLKEEAFKMAEIFSKNPEAKEAIDFANKNSELFTDGLIKIVGDNNQNNSQREIAALFLATKKDKRAFETFIKCLDSSNDAIRTFAARGLGNIGDKKAVKNLCEAWSLETTNCKWEDKIYSHTVILEIAIALVRLGDKKAVPFFLKTYNNDDRIFNLISAIALYGILKEDIYLNVIKDVLQSNDPFRVKIIFMLEDICNKNNKDTIIHLLRKCLNDDNPEIRRVTKITLGNIGKLGTSPNSNKNWR